MKSFSDRNPVLIAINGLTLIVVLMVGAMSFNRLPLISGTTYRAQFSDASGLVKGESPGSRSARSRASVSTSRSSRWSSP